MFRQTIYRLWEGKASARILMYAKFKDAYAMDIGNKEERFCCNVNDFCVVLPIPQDSPELPSLTRTQEGMEEEREETNVGVKEGDPEGGKEKRKENEKGEEWTKGMERNVGWQERKEEEEMACQPFDELEINLISEGENLVLIGVYSKTSAPVGVFTKE